MTPYDLSKSDPSSVLWGGEIRTDEQQETEEPLRDTKGRPVSKNEEYFIAYLESKDGVELTHNFRMKTVYERIVHAEDIASFCFDDEEGKSVINCKPVLGKDLIG